MQHQHKPTMPEPWEGTPRAIMNAQLPQIIQLYAETAMPWLLLKCKARTCFCLMRSRLTKKQIAFQFREYAQGNPLPQNAIQQHPISLTVWNAILEIDLLRWYKQVNPPFFHQLVSPLSTNTAHKPMQQPQGHALNERSTQHPHPFETKALNQTVPSYNQLSKKPSFKKETQQFSQEAMRAPI